MEDLAWAFDQPVQSKEHQDLANTAWIGGDLVTVRYWLGRLVQRNFFRESDGAVGEALHNYLVSIGCAKGAQLVSDFQVWSAIVPFLESQVKAGEGRPPTRNRTG